MDEASDEEMVHYAMINSYNIIIEEHLGDDLIGVDKGWFAHDWNEPVNKDILKHMLTYFVEIEHYEKCHKIQNVLKNWDKTKYRKI
jgi:hypothetical protein|tara:strand:+ start:182 stop:439 length:258 start_codon:yes stop_codon:yes gene_type:complete